MSIEEVDGYKLDMIYVLGYPSDLGGADTELWHTLRLWRKHDVDVTLLPTWKAPQKWLDATESIGVKTVHMSADEIVNNSELNGCTMVSFCNAAFLELASKLKDKDMRLVWVNCMTFVFDKERAFLATGKTFDACVFQSQYQRSKLGTALKLAGQPEEVFVDIKGAFDPELMPFNYRPREPGGHFTIGRLARPDPDKWSSNSWKIYGGVPFTNKNVVLMGLDDKVEAKLGATPDFGSVLRPNVMEVPTFLGLLHCMMPINGGACENWPRVGLEAMAAGVPIVTQAEWGWKEMIDHGETGFLGRDDCELSYYAGVLAHEEGTRRRIAENAHTKLCQDFSGSFESWANIL